MHIAPFLMKITDIIHNKQRKNDDDEPIHDIDFRDTVLIICAVFTCVLAIVICIVKIFGPMPTHDTHPPRHYY